MRMDKPLFCDICITERCLFRCQMCHLWNNTSPGTELSLDEWKNFVCALEDFGGHDTRIHIAGGEPLVKDGVLDLVGFAAGKGFPVVMVTNGFLVDELMAEKIAQAGPDVVSVSIDSLDHATHDFLRGKNGALLRALAATEHLARARVKGVSVLAVIMGPNLDHLVRLAEWVEASPHISSIYFQAVSRPLAAPCDENWFKSREYGFLWPSDMAKVNQVLDELIARKKKGFKISNAARQLDAFRRYFADPLRLRQNEICTQGDHVVSVRPTGEVYLCGAMGQVGNVRTDRIKDIWHSPRAEAAREKIYTCRDNCLNVLNCFVDKELI